MLSIIILLGTIKPQYALLVDTKKVWTSKSLRGFVHFIIIIWTIYYIKNNHCVLRRILFIHFETEVF